MKGKYTFQVQLGYHDLFPNGKDDIKDLLFPLTRRQFFSIFVQFGNDFINKPLPEVLLSIDGKHYWPFAENLRSRLYKYRSNHPIQQPIVNSETDILACDLSLIEILREELSIGSTSHNVLSERECYERFIKALLLSNDLVFDLSSDKRNAESYDEVLRLLISNNFSIYSITGLNNNDLGLSELFKALELMEFVEEDKLVNSWMTNFLISLNTKDYRSYLCKYLCLGSIYKKEGKYTPVGLSQECSPFNKVDINEVIMLDDNIDYRSFRERPLIEIEPELYELIAVPFLLQKTYSSLIFDLLKVSGLKPQQFFGYMDKKFSEERVFSKYMKQSFPIVDSRMERLDGRQIESLNVSSKKKYHPLDFYVKVGNSVFLFEHKDIRINAKDRISRDFNQIKDAIYKKLVQAPDGSVLGVSQLADNVDRINNNDFPWRPNLQAKKVRIYPILVLFDSQFNLHGLNALLNAELRNRIKTSTKNVADLTIIDDATFIKFGNLFASGKISFLKSIVGYHDYVNRFDKKSVDGILSSFISYPDYMDRRYKRVNMLKKLNALIRKTGLKAGLNAK